MSTATAPAAPAKPRPAPDFARAVEIGAVMDRAVGSRLADAEQLALAIPAIAGDGLECVELYLSPAGTFTALARLAADAEVAPLRRRFAFWCARAGARPVLLSELGESQRDAFNANLSRCRSRAALLPEGYAPDVASFFDAAGATPGRSPDGAGVPALVLEVGGAGWSEVRYRAAERALFVPSALSPVEGDSIRFCLRTPEGDLAGCAARMVSVRDEASPGAPAGFTLELLDPPEDLETLLDERRDSEAGDGESRRSHPRYCVRAAARVVPLAESSGELPGDLALDDDGLPRFLLENVSLGGAYVRTGEAYAVGTLVEVLAKLPTGDTLRCPAAVVCHDERGMGVRWEIDALPETELAAVVARVAARPRRALVIDDDALTRRMLADALHDRGFEAITAVDGAVGLQVLSEEILSLDLLVTDLRMPQMDGEVLLHTVRCAGGESELAIVIVSGTVEPALEARLTRQGADAVLPKELGPRLIARAAAAVLERKRAPRG